MAGSGPSLRSRRPTHWRSTNVLSCLTGPRNYHLPAPYLNWATAPHQPSRSSNTSFHCRFFPITICLLDAGHAARGVLLVLCRWGLAGTSEWHLQFRRVEIDMPSYHSLVPRRARLRQRAKTTPYPTKAMKKDEGIRHFPPVLCKATGHCHAGWSHLLYIPLKKSISSSPIVGNTYLPT